MTTKSVKELRQELADYKRRVREDECDIGMMVSIVAHLREELEDFKMEDKMDTKPSLATQVMDLEVQNDYLADENASLAEHLEKIGYTRGEIDNIAQGDNNSVPNTNDRSNELKNLLNHLREQGYNDYEMDCIAKGDSKSADTRMQETYPKLEEKVQLLQSQKWSLEMKMIRIHELVTELNKEK